MENKQQWLRERKNYLGGSDLGAIAGLNTYRTALDVYLDKTSDEIRCETSPAMRWGNLLEEAVAEAYSEDTGKMVWKWIQPIKHKEYPFLAANIDRWVGDREYVLECKTAGFNKGKEWGEVGTDQIPESYLIQCAFYASICDVPKVDIAVLIAGQDFRIYTYNRNKDLEDKIIKIGVNFWHNHIEKRIPPKCVNTRDTFNLFPESHHHEIVAESNIMDKWEQLKAARAEESDNQGNVIATWKNTAPKSLVNVNKLKEMFKDAYEQCLNTGKQSRMFLIK